MEEVTRQDKLEAIEGICQYDRKLIDGLGELADNLESGKETLPSKLLETIMQGVNWTVTVLNQVMDVLDEGEERLDKKMVNASLVAFHDAVTSGDGRKIAEAIRKFLVPCLERICEAGEKCEKMF